MAVPQDAAKGQKFQPFATPKKVLEKAPRV